MILAIWLLGLISSDWVGSIPWLVLSLYSFSSVDKETEAYSGSGSSGCESRTVDGDDFVENGPSSINGPSHWDWPAQNVEKSLEVGVSTANESLLISNFIWPCVIEVDNRGHCWREDDLLDIRSFKTEASQGSELFSQSWIIAEFSSQCFE